MRRRGIKRRATVAPPNANIPFKDHKLSMKNIFLFGIVSVFIGLPPLARAFKVDSQQVTSVAMNKTVPVKFILPDSANLGRETFPALYLLHGAGDNEGTWLNLTSIGALADQYGIIVACPNADASWYFDSPENPQSKYETFVSRELVQYVDGHYRTRIDRKFRAIAGNSMGGHGALFLAIRHPDVFGIAVSMSGGVDFRPFPDNWNIKNVIGTIEEHPERWNDLVVLNQAKNLKDGDLALSIECGTSDFFLTVNRALHRELLAQKVSHDYSERPGSHGWPYWSNAIKCEMLFISEHFKQAETRKIAPTTIPAVKTGRLEPSHGMRRLPEESQSC
jgi:S-formylglutathione hydrolase FrmB